jgi:Helix-turn-helix domain of resolvase
MAIFAKPPQAHCQLGPFFAGPVPVRRDWLLVPGSLGPVCYLDTTRDDSFASEPRPDYVPPGQGEETAGRPRKMDARKITMARTLLDNPDANVTDVCDTLHVSRATLYRQLEKSAGK